MEQVTSFSRRFHLSGAVESQAAEFYRLAEVRGMLRVRGVSSTGLAMVCLEIASGQHGEAFNKVPSPLSLSLFFCHSLSHPPSPSSLSSPLWKSPATCS